jgi:CBS-domain-containing membrane protein
MVIRVVGVRTTTYFKQTVRLLQELRISAPPVVDHDGRLIRRGFPGTRARRSP